MAGVSGKKGRNISKQNIIETNFPSVGFKSIRALHAATVGDSIIDLTALNAPGIAVSNGYVAPSVSDLQRVSMLQFKQNVTLKTDSTPLLQDVQYVITGARTIRLVQLAGPGQIYEITINAEPRTGTPLVDARPLSVTGVLLTGNVDFNVGAPFEVGKFINSQIGAVSVYADGILLKRNIGNQPGGAADYYEVHAGAGLGTIIRFNSSIGVDRDICVISVGSLVERPDGSQDALIDTLAGQIDTVRAEVESQHGIVISPGVPNNLDLKAFGDRVLSLEQGVPPTAAKVHEVVSTVIPDNILVTLDFGGESFDTGGHHDLVVNPSRLTVFSDGIYEVGVTFKFISLTAFGVLNAGIRLNGASFLAQMDKEFTLPVPNSWNFSMTSIAELSAGDFLEFTVFQGTGVAINTFAPSPSTSYFWIKGPF